MPDKCVCRKELVQKPYVGEITTGFTDATMAVPGMRWECPDPDHDANWRWRECGLANDHDCGGVTYRQCKHRSFDVRIHTAVVHWCASCPIPAKDELIAKLVDAVKAAKGYCSDANRMDCAACMIALRGGCEFLNALAAHEAAVKEAADAD